MLSIIVPVYNAETTIERCVTSILANRGVSLEVILVDDGSADGSARICDALAQTDDRVRVIHKVNGGPGSARNTGIREAKGQYLGFVDADDTVAENMYVHMLNLARESRVECVMCGITSVFARYTEPMHHAFGDQCILGKENVREHILEALLVPGHPKEALLASVCNKLYKTEILRAGNVHFENFLRAEDWLFNIVFFLQAGSVGFVRDLLYNYDRTTEGSLSKTWKTDSFDDSIRIQNRLAELFPERYDGQKLLRGVLNMQANNLRMYAVCFGIRGFFAYAKELFRHEQIQTAYREIEEMPREYKFPAVCQRNRWEKLYLLWCLYIGKFGFLKSALRPAYKYLRSLLRR